MSHPDRAADQRSADAVVAHHAQLAETLNRHTRQVLAAAEHGDLPRTARAQRDLLTWLHGDLLPHALAEERTLYPAAARAGGRLLVDGMLDEHRVLAELVAELDAAGDAPVRAAATAKAIAAVFATHLAKENTLVLPLLVDAADVSLAGLLDGMHDLLGSHEHPDGDTTSGGCGCGGCGCGAESAPSGTDSQVVTIDPRIDVRDMPRRHRHAHVLAAMDAVPPGGAIVLIADHAPRPLLAEIAVRYDGRFAADWQQSGPQVWQIRLHHTPTPV